MSVIKKIVLIICFSISFVVIVGCNQEEPPVNVEENKVFQRVDCVTNQVQNELIEFALYEKELKIASEGNPFDYNYFKVMMEFTSPTGKKIIMPAFWYQASDITLNTLYNGTPQGISGVASQSRDEIQGLEMVTPYGDPHYRVRFLPEEYGKYSYRVLVYKNNELVSEEHKQTIDVSKGNESYPGILEVDQNTKRNFVFRNTNKTFVMVGQNTAWYTSTTRKTEDYGVWFKEMHDHNMNTGRVWMATWGFALHWGEKFDDFSTRFAAAARLDKMFEYAKQYDIYFLLCLNNHGQFSSTTNAEWNKNPYNSANGGICDNAFEFFTKEEAKTAYKNELMYIVARYGYSNNIISWELFNEVDYCDNYGFISQRYKLWHNEMATFLKEIDPYSHMVSTSYKGPDGNAYSLDVIDFVSCHDYSYSNKNWNNNIKKTQEDLFNKYKKPIFFGEIGLATQNGYQVYEQDKTGVTLHQGMWAGMMSGGAGGAMNWWWDSYVHPNHLYDRYFGAGAFAKLMDLTGKDYKVINDILSIDNSNISGMGYRFNNRIYGYLYDNAWTYINTNQAEKKNVNVSISMTPGTYTLTFYNTETGEVISSQPITSNGSVSFTVPSIRTDIAFIIN